MATIESGEVPFGDEGGRQRLPLYAHRHPNLTWRSNWFRQSRSTDVLRLIRFRDIAFQHKLDLIRRYGRGSGTRAGYDPAGAGSPWYSVGPRNINGRVKSLAVHPTDPQTVYAGAAAGGVWKTVNGGETWDPLWNTQETLAIGAIAISTSSPNIIYVGSGEWTPGWSGNYGGAGVYVSTDAGVTWSKRPAVQSRFIAKLVVDPMDSQRLWVCGNRGLERSTDGGVTWTTLSSSFVTDIVLDPLNPDTLFVAIGYDGFYKSTDGGTTLTLLPGSPTGATVSTFPQVAVGKSGAHANDFIVIMMTTTVQRSTDGGTTFTAVPGTHGGIWPGWDDVIAVAPDDEDIIFWGGVALDRTDDGGNLWKSLPVHADQHVVAFAPSNLNIVYIANDGGVYRSADKGATVEKVSNGLVITQFYNVNFWSSLSNVMGGGSQDNGVNFTTGGLSWTNIYGGDGGWIIIDPVDPRIIYTESQNANIVKSTDGGRTWVRKIDGIVGPRPWQGVMTMNPSDHLRIFYGTDRVLRSTDGLDTAWQECSEVLTGQVTAIAFAPSLSSRMYVGTTSGRVYRSDDGGDTQPWAEKSGSLPRRPITGIHPISNEGDVVVSVGGLSGAASSESVYRSTDGGDTWTDVSGDLPDVVGNSVAVDPSNSSILYLATDTGVFRTTNGGTNWLAFDNGIPNVPCTGLIVDVSSKMLYCGTFGRGAYKLDINLGVVKDPVDLYVRDHTLDTGERFPSPSGYPDPLIPAPGLAHFWMSPDIKVNHEPFFTKVGVFDGVDFDTALSHQDPYRGERNRFYVQVHNRGWQTTRNVSVRAFIADASAGLPNLPNRLTPPNFDLVSNRPWTPVGPARNISELKPNRPAVVVWDFDIPVTGATHSCCLVVTSSPDDPFDNPAVNIAQLIRGDKRVCLKNLHVVDPGPGRMPPTKHSIDFNNPTSQRALLDIIVRPSGFSAGKIGLLLPRITFADVKQRYQDVVVVPLAGDDPVGKWYFRGDKKVERLLEKRFQNCDRSHLFEFNANTSSAVRGIELEPGQTLRGVLVSTLRNNVYLTGPSRFEVIQLLDGKLAGGSTFQFGYELPAPGTTPVCRRIRITADRLVWKGCGHRHDRGHARCDCSILIARVVVADDMARVSDRLLVRERTDAYEEDEDSGEKGARGVTEVVKGLKIETAERKLYERRWGGDSGIQRRLGKYGGTGEDGLELEYTIKEL
ncbi:hypothetical protein H2199_006611 [Coniosporium tulheliwenetii]|uniref:Uncharacterized protein n=1 Tax=Coniosporium tulheliwenetii TaxID=3383036 RepID=A0ACC2YTZ7_9PEZI|nr:hypothetical protein H2199_006611 [Cladosporium sp. JES 115]